MSFLNLMFNPFRKRHPDHLAGELLCPFCDSTRNKLYSRITPFVTEYECKNCHYHYQYESSPRGFYGDGVKGEIGNPFGGFKLPDSKLSCLKRNLETLASLGRRKNPKIVFNGQRYDVGVHKYSR